MNSINMCHRETTIFYAPLRVPAVYPLIRSFTRGWNYLPGHLISFKISRQGMMYMATDWTWCVTVNKSRMAVRQE